MVDQTSIGIWQGIKRWWSDVLGTKVYFRYLEKEDRKRRLAGQFSTFITLILGCYYIIWHFKSINWGFWYYSPVFFLAEFIGLLLFSFFAIDAWFLRYHSPEGIPIETPLSVDVFITVAGEPIELLRETLEATVRIDYHLKKIYILDDKGDIKYQRLAEKYGCGYFAREDHSDAKAGNLNYAFQRTSSDLILTLDADQVPHPEIIEKLNGFFKIPLIAFVQTKQDFELGPGFAAFLQWLNTYWLWAFGLCVANLAVQHWTLATRVVDLALNLYGAVMFAAMFMGSPFLAVPVATFAAKSVLAVVCFVFLLGALDQFIHLLRWQPRAEEAADTGVS